MRISFSPQRRNDGLEVSRAGDVLTINGDTLDLSVLAEGDSIPNAALLHPLLTGAIARIEGELSLTLVLPVSASPSAATAFPADLVDPPDGPLAIPADPEEPANGDN